jgi:tetratricopeptide (TPR) repeat protein
MPSLDDILRRLESLESGRRFGDLERELGPALASYPDDPDLNAWNGIMLARSLREPEAVASLRAAQGSALEPRLAQMLVDHFECRRRMARKLGASDPAGVRAAAELRRLTRLKPGKVGVRLSATLIVRNEESNLPRCLASLVGVADEIVVVDTGSTDLTVEVARAAGARVGSFAWRDDFSAARNAALELATGDWALWIDADEALAEGSGRMIQEAIMRPCFGGFHIRINNVVGDGMVDQFVHVPVRLFRLTPETRFEGRIHEQVAPSLQRQGLILATLEGAAIDHYGYTPQAMAERNKIERTLALLEREIASEPGNAFHWFNLANTLAVARRYAEAEAAARKALAALPEEAPYGSLLYQLLATALLEQGRAEEALEACDACDAAGYGTILNMFERGHALVALDRFDEALEVALECLQAGWPSWLQGDHGIFTHKRHVLLGQALTGLGRYGEALPLFERALGVDPAYMVGLFSYGVCLALMGRFQEAIPVLERCYSLDRYGPAAMAYAAQALAALGRHGEAADLWERRWESGGREPELFPLWAGAAGSSGDPARVVRAYEALSEASELSAPLLVQWGRAYAAAGDAPRALTCFQEAIRRDPSDANAFFNAGDLLASSGGWLDAARLYEQGLRLAPAHAPGWFVLGNCLYRLGMPEGAKTAYEQALLIEPNYPEARANLNLVLDELEAAA